MKREVVITSRAQTEIQTILEYLEIKWNEKTKRKFANKINSIMIQIVKNPELFPVSTVNKKIRKAVVSRQSSLFYHFNNKYIVVVSLFDTRQNPSKIKKTQ